MSSHGEFGATRHQTTGHVSGMNLDGTTDSPRGSQKGSRPSSEAGDSPHKASGSTKPPPFKASEGYDPARNTEKKLTPAEIVGKRVDLPIDAYREEGKDMARFAARPGYNSIGKQIKIQLNIFNVVNLPRADIYQYDVSITPIPEKRSPRPLFKKVWNSAPVKRALARAGGKWLFDGNKLAWSSNKLPRNEERINIDLDVEAGKDSRGENVYFIIKLTKPVRLEYLTAYLRGKASWDSTILECMSFLDHVMRQSPSETLIPIKRNFYSPQANRNPLDVLLEVIKGTYSAFRLSDSILRGGTGMSVNVDISNTTFWQCHRVSEVALRIVNSYKPEWKAMSMNRLATECKPIRSQRSDGTTIIAMSEAFKVLRRLVRLKFRVNHRGKLGSPKVYTIADLVWNVPKYGAEGANSTNATFKMRDGSTPTVAQYFHDRYGIRLQYPYLPMIETSKHEYYPMEVCNLIDHQRYPFKLDPTQTASMIKIAVTRPDKRKADILAGVDELDWKGDQYLKAFGIGINPTMVVTDARLLQNPEITYANKKENPGVSGRWDLRGKKFWESNTRALKSWGMVAVGDACTKAHLESFSSTFCNIYRGHGGRIEKAPLILEAPYSIGDHGKITEWAYHYIGKENKEWPTIIFFVLSNKNQLVYDRVKKSMECRWCLVSQCLQGMHVKKAQAQYCSNVAMKVNAKLGGVTCKIAGPDANKPPFWQCPTMIIGLDVTHGAHRSGQPSMAAMTVSTDRHATRYAGSCEVNGFEKEIVDERKMGILLNKLLGYWHQTNGAYPRHVYYFRDGVSDGQFQKVIDDEIKGIKRCFREKNFPEPKFTVIVATKRHHVRFFPKPGDRAAADRNNNPLPGTLVEHDVTHPYHFDFYLCSHVAIQGTARPVHYNVIYDDFGVDANLLQKMIYQQCYQYCRSTTPVSLHPAVYYSHLASQRARAHEDLASSQREMGPSGKQGFPIGKAPSDVHSDPRDTEPIPLLPMSNHQGTVDNIKHLNTTMWYV